MPNRKKTTMTKIARIVRISIPASIIAIALGIIIQGVFDMVTSEVSTDPMPYSLEEIQFDTVTLFNNEPYHTVHFGAGNGFTLTVIMYDNDFEVGLGRREKLTWYKADEQGITQVEKQPYRVSIKEGDNPAMVVWMTEEEYWHDFLLCDNSPSVDLTEAITQKGKEK